MSKEKKEISEKNRMYQKKRKSVVRICIFAVVMIYAFFFTSKLIIPAPLTGPGEVTRIGQEAEYAENRTCSLISADYAQEQELMEIVLTFTNENYDGIDDYYYALECTGASTKKLTIKEVYHEDLFTVLRIQNLPKGYHELTLLYAPKLVAMEEVTDDMTGKVILNKHNVEETAKIDTGKNRADYYKERLSAMEDALEEKLARQQAKLSELEIRKKALEDEIMEIEENRLYMTADEIQMQQERAISNTEEIAGTDEEIILQKKRIEAIKESIKDVREKENAL